MKKLTNLLFILFMLTSLIACGSDSTTTTTTDDDNETNTETEGAGGTVTISGTLSTTSAAAMLTKANISAATVASGYKVHILNTATGGQKTADIGTDGTFSFSAAGGASYMVNFMNSENKYIGTLATGSETDSQISVALTTGADASTTNLGAVTANETTGQIVSDQTLEADTDHMAVSSSGIIAGGTSGEGTTDYSSTVGTTCTENAIDCPDFDHDGVPDTFDTDNNNNGYADEIDGDIDLCVPGTVALYVENYPTSGSGLTQDQFPNPDEIDADLASNSMYNVRLEFTPASGYSISTISVTTPSYIDNYGYVYHVASGHECFNTLWTTCNNKQLMLSDDESIYEMTLADIDLTRAGILENMFPGDIFTLDITLDDETSYVCTKKINIIPKYYPYNFRKDRADAALVDTSDTLTDWTGTLNLFWEISSRAPSGMTYVARITPYNTADSGCDWDPIVYTDFEAGQDATSISIETADLPTSTANQWSIALVSTDATGDVSRTNPVQFTTQGTDQCAE